MSRGKSPCHCDAGFSDEDRCQNCDQKLIRPMGRWLDWTLAIGAGLVVIWITRRWHP